MALVYSSIGWELNKNIIINTHGYSFCNDILFQTYSTMAIL